MTERPTVRLREWADWTRAYWCTSVTDHVRSKHWMSPASAHTVTPRSATRDTTIQVSLRYRLMSLSRVPSDAACAPQARANLHAWSQRSAAQLLMVLLLQRGVFPALFPQLLSHVSIMTSAAYPNLAAPCGIPIYTLPEPAFAKDRLWQQHGVQTLKQQSRPFPSHLPIHRRTLIFRCVKPLCDWTRKLIAGRALGPAECDQNKKLVEKYREHRKKCVLSRQHVAATAPPAQGSMSGAHADARVATKQHVASMAGAVSSLRVSPHSVIPALASVSSAPIATKAAVASHSSLDSAPNPDRIATGSPCEIICGYWSVARRQCL